MQFSQNKYRPFSSWVGLDGRGGSASRSMVGVGLESNIYVGNDVGVGWTVLVGKSETTDPWQADRLMESGNKIKPASKILGQGPGFIVMNSKCPGIPAR